MDALFYPLLAGCVLAVVSALAVVLARKPVYAVVALLAHTLSLAGLFAILGAGFIAVGQVIIYSGAIVVLFLIVVTLLPLGSEPQVPSGTRVALAIVGGGALLVAFATAIAPGAPAAAGMPGGVTDVGRALFGPFIVPFQVTAILLLVAAIGAVAVWRRHEPHRPGAPRTTREHPERRLVIHR